MKEKKEKEIKRKKKKKKGKKERSEEKIFIILCNIFLIESVEGKNSINFTKR
jgi:hypothetical protein